jgi:hypothetical protein
MSLMAIILWALYPLSPWKRYYEAARWLLDVLIRNIQDQATVDWLCAYPDDPRGISHVERAIDDLNASIDLLIYIRARELLGLKAGRWRRPKPSPPQRRRSRTFNELYARLRACGLRFSQIERLATRRAEKLKRLLAASPDLLPRAGEGPRTLSEQQANSGGGPAYLLAAPFEATAPPVPHLIAPAATSADASLPRSGEEAGERCAVFIIVSQPTPAHLRAGLRVRAPP